MLVVSPEVRDWHELGLVPVLHEVPDVNHALRSMSANLSSRDKSEHTELVPAQSVNPSLAIVMLATLTFSSGISWWLQLFSARSQIRTLPERSQLIISPWLGWITTSLTGQP